MYGSVERHPMRKIRSICPRKPVRLPIALAWLKGKADRTVRAELEEEKGHEEEREIEIVGGV